MSTGSSKFFFSYAREDSEFVLKLAKQLRKAGASLWVDRLDILGGQRWDESVQEALESCQGMLAILSPCAVSSQNFMDEVSYALEERKQVIPVLYRECTIPFRLRRVQYVNFISDYDNGFADLLRALVLEQTINSNAFLVKEGESPKGAVQPAAHEEEQRDRAEATKEGAKQEAGQEMQRNVEHNRAREEAEKVRSEVKEGSQELIELATRIAIKQLSAIIDILHKALQHRWVRVLVGAIAGSMMGASACLLSDRSADHKWWWAGALYSGIPCAIAGALTGRSRRRTYCTLVAALAGAVVALPGGNFRIPFLLGAPIGAVLGAIAGVMLKRFQGWES